MAEKLKQEGKQEMLQQETMEELEDEEGNVYDKKVSRHAHACAFRRSWLTVLVCAPRRTRILNDRDLFKRLLACNSTLKAFTISNTGDN